MTVVESVSAAPIDCETAVQRLWDYLDGRLAPGARAAVDAHLAACALCPPHFAFAHRVQRALGAAAPPAAADEEARLRARVLGALRRVGGAGTAG